MPQRSKLSRKWFFTSCKRCEKYYLQTLGRFFPRRRKGETEKIFAFIKTYLPYNFGVFLCEECRNPRPHLACIKSWFPLSGEPYTTLCYCCEKQQGVISAWSLECGDIYLHIRKTYQKTLDTIFSWFFLLWWNVDIYKWQEERPKDKKKEAVLKA